jgi:hypothetical protein
VEVVVQEKAFPMAAECELGVVEEELVCWSFADDPIVAQELFAD